MSGPFAPGQRVRCVKEDILGEDTVRVGDVLTVGRLVATGQGFRTPGQHCSGYVWCKNFVPVTEPGPWTEWPGGECPVAPDVRVEVQLADGYRHLPMRACRLIWERRDGANHIVAYRLAADSAEPAPSAAQPRDREPGIAAIKAEVGRLDQQDREGDLTDYGRDKIAMLRWCLEQFGIRTTIHPPQPARVDFEEQA